MLKNISKIVQGIELAVYSAMVPYGEYIQNEVLLGKTDYTWVVGHITDIGYAGGLTTFAMIVLKAEDKLRNALLIPTAMSALELLTSIHPKINFDWQDVACYYCASLFAYGVNKICTTNIKDQKSV